MRSRLNRCQQVNPASKCRGGEDEEEQVEICDPETQRISRYMDNYTRRRENARKWERERDNGNNAFALNRDSQRAFVQHSSTSPAAAEDLRSSEAQT